MTEPKNSSVQEEKRDSIEGVSDDIGIVGEFWEFLRENKKFWLIPILLVLGLLAALLLASPSALSPFIYALF